MTSAPPNGPDPDLPLVQRALAGDRSAAAEIVQRHREPLTRLVGRYLQTPADAADVVQDAFVRAFERLATFQRRGPFRAWLFRIGINLALDRKFELKSELPSDVEDDALFTNSLGTSRLVTADLWRRVARAIETLPAKQRLVSELRLYHQLSFEEIADVTGSSVDAAKMNFHHALKRLRDVPQE